MARVTINRGQPEPTDKFGDWPRERWKYLLQRKSTFIHSRIPHDCRCLLEFIEEAEGVWEALGYESKDDMLIRGYELDPAEVNHAVEWLKIRRPDWAVEFADAVVLGRHGGDRKLKGRDQVRNTNLKSQTQTVAYTLARLRRDNPDLAKQVEAGELSANAAAIQAGFRKPTATIPTNDLDAAMRVMLKHFTKRQLLKALQSD